MSGDNEVAVLGVGIMGSGVAAACALAGMSVTTLSRHPEEAYDRVCRILADACRYEVVAPESTDRARLALRCVEEPQRIPRSVTVVLESLPEVLEVKLEVLTHVINHLGADTVVATNTSSLRISDIGRGTDAEHTTVGLHFMNPALLMPLVELVPGEATRGDVLERCERLARRLRKNVIHVRRDLPGFAWNRLQMALLREAVQLVDDGVVSIDDVDAAVALGLARRWQHAGPLATARLGGAETFRTVARNLLPICSTRGELDNLESFLPSVAAVQGVASAREKALADLLRMGRSGPEQHDSP